MIEYKFYSYGKRSGLVLYDSETKSKKKLFFAVFRYKVKILGKSNELQVEWA